ncbi:MAG: HAMP domain-containing sensor histidine kinase [Pseudomonadota bacterium]
MSANVQGTVAHYRQLESLTTRPVTSDPMRRHDIRHLVASVTLAAEELSNAADDRTRVLAGRILRAAHRIVDVNEDGSRRAPEGHEGEPASLCAILEDLRSVAACLAGPAIRVSVFADHDIDCGLAGTTIFRILSNLVVNSVAVVNERGYGWVEVTTVRWGQAVHVLVSDSGPGLLSNKQASETGTRPGAQQRTPSGLGLIIAQSLALGAGLQLNLVSSSQTGTCFRLVVPSRRQQPATRNQSTNEPRKIIPYDSYQSTALTR